MSFDIYLSTTTEDEDFMFDRAIVERAFREIVEDLTDEDWTLRMANCEEAWTTVSVADEPKILRLSANRPPSFEAFPEFWNAMFEVLVQTRTILFWPGGGPHPNYCVANPAMIENLSPDLLESMGKPAIVTSRAEIDAAISLSGH